jgi:signal peptidase I
MSLSLRIAKYGLYILLFSLTLVFLRLFLFQIILVKGNSMLPTLKDGSIVLVYKRNFPQKSMLSEKFLTFGQLDIRRFDLVLFDTGEGKLLVKRLIGLPGDFYAFKSGSILIDNKPLIENYTLSSESIPFKSSPVDGSSSPFFYNLSNEGRIPPGYYLLLGDNRRISYDSRDMGLIPEENLRGKIVYVLSY